MGIGIKYWFISSSGVFEHVGDWLTGNYQTEWLSAGPRTWTQIWVGFARLLILQIFQSDVADDVSALSFQSHGFPRVPARPTRSAIRLTLT
jgi:hypothetical protein